MKTLTSKFLAVALLLSVFAPVAPLFAAQEKSASEEKSAPEKSAPEKSASEEKSAPEKSASEEKSAPENPTSETKTSWSDSFKNACNNAWEKTKFGANKAWAPFTKVAEQVTKDAQAREALLNKDKKDLSWTEFLYSKPAAQAGNWVDANQNASNWMYRGGVVVTLAALGGLGYWLYNKYSNKAEDNRLQSEKLEELKKAATEDEANLRNVFYKLNLTKRVPTKEMSELENAVKRASMTETEFDANLRAQKKEVSPEAAVLLTKTAKELKQDAKDELLNLLDTLIKAAKEKEAEEAKKSEAKSEAKAEEVK